MLSNQPALIQFVLKLQQIRRMMKTGYRISVLFILLAAFSCAADHAVDDAYAQVLALHDEVMPQMSTMSGLEMTLQEIVKDSTISQSGLDSLQQCLKALGDAEEGMWEWMNQFKKPETGTDKNEALRYLETKKESIKMVGTAMASSMESAQKLVDQYKK